MDEQFAVARVATECHYPAVGYLPFGTRWLQQVPPVRLRCLPLPVEAGAGVQERLSEHSTLHTKRANCQVER